MKHHLVCCLTLCSLLLCACGRSDTGAPQATTAPAPSAGIEWFEGGVSEAFALAKERDQPLFLYWGAVWCPPCNQLRSTVFRDPAFIEMTRAFVAVYLDGDSEGAQRWGEHFGAAGYPTLIVFGPQGEERTRLTSGMALERYPQALQAALKQNESIAAVLARGLEEPQSLTDDHWQLLARTAWDADDGRLLGQEDRANTLSTLAQHCPATSQPHCRRLKLLSSIASLDQESTPTTIENLQQILADPQLTHDNLSELQYHAVELSRSAPADVRAILYARLQTLAERSFADTRLPLKARMLGTRLHMDLRRDENGQLPQDDADLQALVRARAAWADEAATTPAERQSLIYNAAWYLHEVGLSDAAVELLQAELGNAVAPYYYMSYLASIEKARNNATRALGWSARAWQLATGPATRTQWGTQHVLNLIELAPDQIDTIETVANQLLDGVAQSQDGYYQRTRTRMQRLHDTLAQWSQDKPKREAAASRLRQRIGALCAQSATDCSALTGAQ